MEGRIFSGPALKRTVVGSLNGCVDPRVRSSRSDVCNADSIPESVFQVFVARKTVPRNGGSLDILCACAERIMLKTMPVYAHTHLSPQDFALLPTEQNGLWSPKRPIFHFIHFLETLKRPGRESSLSQFTSFPSLSRFSIILLDNYSFSFAIIELPKRMFVL